MINPFGVLVFVFGGLVIAIAIAGGILAFFEKIYYSRRNVMTEGELRFFHELQKVVSLPDVILCQVRLASLVGPKGDFIWRDFRPLVIRSVDFVIINSKTGYTKLVIELDDASHRLPKRRFRYRYVDRVLQNAGIRILHLPYQVEYDLKSIINL